MPTQSTENPKELETNKIHANALNLIPELGPIKLAKLLAFFGNFPLAWTATKKEYLQTSLDEKTINQIIAKKNEIDPVDSYEALKKAGIDILLITDSDYPKLLLEIPNPPPILYFRGNKKLLSLQSIAVVGTRLISLYGKQACEEIVSALSQNGINIVSGLAFGVDAESLATALECGKSPVAVLASSIDNNSISPRANFNLAQKIISSGCLISEYPLGSQVQKQNFPIRNRIISGLSLGTLIIEADEESGSLITANYALEQGREVFAIPGSIFSRTSRGTNKLIQKGAKLITNANDILEELNIDLASIEVIEKFEETPEEAELLEHLSREPVHVNLIIQNIQKPASAVNATLTLLEMKGRIKNIGGARYVRIR